VSRVGRLQLPATHVLAASLCIGLALPLAVRSAAPAAAAIGVASGVIALAAIALPGSTATTTLLAAALVLAGWWWGSGRLALLDRSELAGAVGSTELATVEITGPARRSAYSIRAPVRVRRFGNLELDEPAALELPASERAPPQGAILELVARARSPRGPDAESDFDEATYLRRRGVHVVLGADVYKVVGRRGGIAGAADRLRAWLAGSIAPGLDGERRALIAGIVLGEDEGLETGLRDRFRASGLYHLLAVSGQNVAFLVAGVLLAAWIAGVPRMLAQLCALGAIVAYVLAVGWQPSVVRAGIAGALASLAWLTARSRDRWYFLLVGAAVLLAWSPYSLLDPGFQLSFSAVAAIFLLVPRFERRLEGYPVPRALGAVLAVSTACGAVTAPILWAHFGSIPILSVLANALAEPVVAPMLGLGLGTAAVGTVLPGAAAAMSWVNGWLAAYLAGCARLIGGLPFAQITSWPVLLAVAGGTGWLAALRSARRPWRRPLLVAGIAAVAAIGGWWLWPRGPALPPPQGLRISFLDVGQGDAALVQVPEGAILVDEGPPEARVVSKLEGLGVDRLAAMVLTHPERDHIGGAADVLRELRVAEILDPRQPNPSPYEDEALDVARARNVRVVTARAGERFKLGKLRLEVLWPDGPGAPGEDPNQHAVVVLASYGAVDALLTADAESEVTGSLRLRPVEILKVAHHGSADEGLPGLLDRLRPEIAVVSVGAGNDYGHPTQSTLAALRAAGSRLFRTDLDGTVVVESDGARISARSER
jgi:competence protein ComEC